MRKYRRHNEQTKQKAENRRCLALEAALPMEELMAGARADIETFAAELGLSIIQSVMAAEISQKAGPWGGQSMHRHGHQAGYVIYGGRKVTLERPRLRSRENKEVPLASYQAFQKNGKMQQAVARQLTRQCSSRDYEGAIEGCLEGYGIKRSSVSRHWKAATAKELECLMQRPVPRDLLVLMIDSKFFGGDAWWPPSALMWQAENTFWESGMEPLRIRRWLKDCSKIWFREVWRVNAKCSSCWTGPKPCAKL